MREGYAYVPQPNLRIKAFFDFAEVLREGRKNSEVAFEARRRGAV